MQLTITGFANAQANGALVRKIEIPRPESPVYVKLGVAAGGIWVTNVWKASATADPTSSEHIDDRDMLAAAVAEVFRVAADGPLALSIRNHGQIVVPDGRRSPAIVVQ